MVGLASTVLVTFYGQTRILMRMSADGMLPPIFGRVSARFKTPTFTTILCGIAGAIVAGLVPIDVLGQLVSIGTLMAFLIVCAGVLVLRRTHPDLERPFRVQRVEIVAPLGILSALALMVTLPDRHLDPPRRLAGHRDDDLLPLRQASHRGALRRARVGGPARWSRTRLRGQTP